MSIKAMQYALEVLENFVEDPRCEAHRIAAVHFLKQAIAEAEKQKPVAWVDVKDSYEGPYEFHGIERMGVGKHLLYTTPVHTIDMSEKHVHESDKHRHEWGLVTDDALIEEVRRRGFTIRDAQISPKVKDEYELCCQKYETCTEPCTPRGRHLAKREWVGLTDGELPEGETYDFDRGVRWAEAKLKEKNQ